MGPKDNKNDADGKVKESSGSSTEFVTSKVFKDYMNKLLSQMNGLTTRLDGVLEENKKLREEATAKDGEIRKLNKRVDFLEQRSRINNVEIANFPVTTNEDPVEIVKSISQLVGADIKPEDIQAVHRVPRFDKKGKNLIVQFCSRWKKNTLIQASLNYRKSNNNKISAAAINSNLPDQGVFISEHLSPKNKVLLAKTKKRVKELGWKTAHTRDGVIFAKKDDQDRKKTMISDEEDLMKMK